MPAGPRSPPSITAGSSTIDRSVDVGRESLMLQREVVSNINIPRREVKTGKCRVVMLECGVATTSRWRRVFRTEGSDARLCYRTDAR